MKSSIDFATVGGTILGFSMIVSTMVLGGNINNFFQVPSILLVIGGTIAVTTVCFSLQDMAMSPKIILNTILYRMGSPKGIATQILKLAEISRSKGVLALENELPNLGRDRMFQKSVRMLVDGVPAKELEQILRNEVGAIKNRHLKSANILKKAGEIAPAMGLIGTLIGLVQMLANLDDPSAIGPAMGLALLTTFYGAVLANMVFNPLASKLERNSQEEEMVNTLYVIGITSIARQENPRRLEMMLNTILPPSLRLKYFD